MNSLNGSRAPGRVAQRAALLGAYVASEVVAHIMSDGAVALPSGVRLTATVLFADIRNFTRLADTLPAERVVALLDEYFEAMTAAALARGAMIDKLIGDAIMLVFGVPRASGDEARRALDTAAAMQRAFAVLLRRWHRALPARLRLGLAVGCASGEVVLANVGSAARMDYTVIGTPVNLAARLTAAARAGETLVSAALRDAVRALPSVRVGRVRHLALKGFAGRIPAYPARMVGEPREPVRAETGTDPVCGMKLSVRRALHLEYRGRRYQFCSPRCRDAFRDHPRRYVRRASRPAAGR